MKNTINISGNASFTVNNTPVTIENFSFSYENECTPAELVTSAGFAKDLLNSFKRYFKDFEVTPASIIHNPTEAHTETPTKAITETPVPSTDLDKIWRDLINAAPKDVECGLATLSLRKDDCRIDAEIEEEVINLHVFIRNDVIHGHIYADHDSWSGTPTRMYSGLLDCCVKDTNEEITSFVKKILELNPAWTGLKYKQ